MIGQMPEETKMKIRIFAAALLLAITGGNALAEDYPARAVRVIIPFPPGGPTDAVGRLIAQKVATQTGQAFLVENRAGGNGVIGADAVAKAAKDGYTLMFNASTFITTDLVSKNTPYSVVKDFIPVALVAKAPLAVSINSQLGPKTIAELVTYGRANPGKLDFAVGSIGSAGHLATELLKRSAGISINIIPYKGSTPAYQDLIGGQIQGFVDPVLGALPFWKGGRTTVLAVTSRERLPSAPDTPTVGATLKGYEAYSWYGLWAPAGTPKDIVTRLNGEVNKALGSELRDKLIEQGYLLSPGSPEDFVKFQRDELAISGKIISDAKIHID
jgi:tripartite-type tricarboxylate transporter receptor subunit TctC